MSTLQAAPMQRRITIALLVATTLAIFVAMLYYPLLFTNRVLAGGDIQLYFYPYRDYAAAALREARIPLWNPYIFNGVPFLANPQAAVLYPLHWPLSWLPVTQQIYWSAAIHTWLLGFGGYLLARRLGLGNWGSLITALVLAGSGFYGGLLGHINQMNGAAWLPWALLVVQIAGSRRMNLMSETRNSLKRVLWGSVWFAPPVALMILAGHTQTAYINLFGIGLWIVWRPLTQLPAWHVTRANGLRLAAAATPSLLVYAIGVLIALLLCAAQLLPTLELSELGLRGGGLHYGEVSSFSLRPTRLPWTLLPTYGLVELGPIFGAGYTEFVGYVGVLGLALALIGAWRGRGGVRTVGLFFAALGLFLALGRWNPVYYLLYKVVPGFDLFRVPARWMMLYTLGMALLAGVGMDWIAARLSPVRVSPVRISLSRRFLSRSALLSGILTFTIAIDLLAAAQALPHAHPTAPQAVYGVRTAPAHLLTDPIRTTLDPAAMGRFLGMSTITFDPGDMADWRRVLLEREPPQLDPAAFYDFVVALKVQELLVPNLPLFRRVPAVDGFDGGVLPLQRYNKFLTLFVPPDQLVPDGRLREQIKEVPSADFLGLFNAQYVITDKVRDLWFDNVYYDRQIGARLDRDRPTVTLEIPHPFTATHLDLIGYVETAQSPLREKQRVATVSVQAADGTVVQLALTAGQGAGAHFAGPQLDDPAAVQSGATVALQDIERGLQEYRARLPLPEPMMPTAITITQYISASDISAPDITAPGITTPLVIQAATLFDARTQMFTPLLPSDRGHFRLVHSGDVKIYETVDVRPRAYLVHEVWAAADADAALASVREREPIQQGRAAVIEFENPEGTAATTRTPFFTTTPHPTDHVEILTYHPEQVTLRATTAEAAFLVLSDTNFPGWQATVDGQPTPLYTANVLFRGLQVPAGQHTVVLRYQPTSWRYGLWVSGLGIMVWVGLLLVSSTRLRFQSEKDP